MDISNAGIELIKSFEGCRLNAYQDSVGVWTIGWGHTKNVYPGMSITQEIADKLLKEDLKSYISNVEEYNIIYNFNQNQFDALVSFAYNIGSIDQLVDHGRRSIPTISEKILLYNKAGGYELAGLTRRRKAEKELFDTPVSNYKNDGWKETSKGWEYYENGKKLKNCWRQINSKWYYFKSNGKMAKTEFVKSKDYNTNKKLYWVRDNGDWDGHEYKWLEDDTGWWLAGIGTGWYAKNEWARVDNKWYYFDSKGYMIKNTKKRIDGTIYEFGKDGALKE